MAATIQPSSQGDIDTVINGTCYNTRYVLFGDLASSSKPPLIILHGGPGVPMVYLMSFSDIYIQHQRPVILYDQLGAGKSTHLPDKGADFWTMDLFMDQLDIVLKHFGLINERGFDLLGHSWGGMLASWYAGSGRDSVKGMKHLVLANSLARDRDWEESSLKLVDDFPEAWVKEAITKHELEGTVENEEYERAMKVFMKRHTCRVDSPELELAFKMLEEEPSQSLAMNGPYFLRCTGSLKDWDVTHLLPNIDVPTLVYHGGHDQAQDSVVEPFFQLIPKVRWVTFPDSSHSQHIEERERCMKLVGEFLAI